ncbi:MAG: GGDEF domain-containing protein, partial [Gammaproteobacteria bacterium]|nr:GGDEF domain-containing protein [Gammaproteobacteria bacterium]
MKGNKLGTLCIIDHEPRHFDEDDFTALKDLAELAEREMSSAQMATLDELTQISNRRGFMMLAQSRLDFCAREKFAASLVYLDLNKFKQINDQFGHAEGDRALVAFAEQMQKCFRDSDVFARLAGDEFVVLLSDTTPQSTDAFLQRFNRMLDQYNREAKRGYEISFSAGVVAVEFEHGATIEELLDKADSSMYEEKKRA